MKKLLLVLYISSLGNAASMSRFFTDKPFSIESDKDPLILDFRKLENTNARRWITKPSDSLDLSTIDLETLYSNRTTDRFVVIDKQIRIGFWMKNSASISSGMELAFFNLSTESSELSFTLMFNFGVIQSIENKTDTNLQSIISLNYNEWNYVSLSCTLQDSLISKSDFKVYVNGQLQVFLEKNYEIVTSFNEGGVEFGEASVFDYLRYFLFKDNLIAVILSKYLISFWWIRLVKNCQQL